MLKKAFKSILIVTAMVLMAASPSLAKEQPMKVMKEIPKAVEMREALRDLLLGHIFWERNVVMSTKMGDAEATKIAEEHVVKNARAIADSVIPYYGENAADTLYGLLAGHYGAVKEYMRACYSGDKAGKEVATEMLKSNSTYIAALLSAINPNWSRETFDLLLLAHAGHHIAQIDAVNVKNYSSEAQTWETMRKHMNMVADALAKGLVKQFPKKF